MRTLLIPFCYGVVMSIMMTAGQVRMGLKIELGVVTVFICCSLYFVFIVNLAFVKGMKIPLRLPPYRLRVSLPLS